MTYVFEGVNRCGKTYLAQILSDSLSIPIFKIYDTKKNIGISEIGDEIKESGIVPVTNFYEDLITIQLLSQIECKGIILDRSLPSEHCYGMLKKKENLHHNISKWWFNKLKEIGGTYIWVVCSWETVQRRGIKEGWLESYYDWQLLHIRYQQMWNMAEAVGVKKYLIPNNIVQQPVCENMIRQIAHDELVNLLRDDKNES